MYKVTKTVYNLYNKSRPEKIKIQTFCKTIYELFEVLNNNLSLENQIQIHKKIGKKRCNKLKLDIVQLNFVLSLKCIRTKEKINQDFKAWKQNQIVEKYDLFVEKKGE